MAETTRETTEHVVTDDPPPLPAAPGSPLPPGAPEGAGSPTTGAVEAIAVGVAIGETVGRATAQADQANAAAAEAAGEMNTWRSRAESAERDRDSLAARVAALEAPPVVEETTLVDVPTREAATPAPAPRPPRGILARVLLGS